MLKRFYGTALAVLLGLAAEGRAWGEQDLASWVDPLIGSAASGNTFPGAVLPWGMVSVSPHNDLDNPAGYSEGKKELYGFGHVHFSGTGCKGLGNVVLMPSLGDLVLERQRFKSAYDSVSATAGFFALRLKPSGILAEMTASPRAGFSRYTFPAGQANVIFDVGQALTTVVQSEVEILSSQEVQGWCQSSGFCSPGTNQETVYFVAQFQQPAQSWQVMQDGKAVADRTAQGRQVAVGLRFPLSLSRSLLVKVGISYVSTQNARQNLLGEISDWDFEGQRQKARQAWNQELGKVAVQGGSSTQRTIFYTALYHSLLEPNVFSDLNGEYQGLGHSGVKQAQGWTQYTIYSLWDTYRTLHPFLCLAYPERQLDMAKSLLAHARDSGWLPKWELAGSDTGVMVGDPAAIVLADTALRGLKGFDSKAGYEAARKGTMTLENNKLRPGYKALLQYGYIPQDDAGGDWVWGPVSTTLEYNLADWALARWAKSLGKLQEAKELERRAMLYRNYYDAESGFLRPRNKDGNWVKPFDPLAECCDKSWPGSGGPDFVEGNAWQYLFAGVQDVKGLAKLLGGDQAYVQKLQQAFDLKQVTLGNEPDMAYAYLFNYFPGQAWRTQKLVRQLMEENYKASADGIPGNDDTGVTSCWYLLSALGLYPTLPGSNAWQIGSPLFDKAVITLNPQFYKAKALVLQTSGNGPQAMFIQSARLNGKPLHGLSISQAQINQGVRLELEMGESH